jgi:integrase
MARITLTDRKVPSLKVSGTFKDKVTGETKPRTRQDHWDSVVPGFAVRVTSRGQRTYILAGRIGVSKNYTRREIGEVGAITLADARKKAQRWLGLISAGKDPAHEEAALARAEARKRENTFESVAEAFIAEWVIGPKPDKPRQRKHKPVTASIRNHLVARWGKRPIADIERGEVVDLIKAKAKAHPAEARNLLTTCKSIFSWAVDQNFGLSHSVCNDIKPGKIIGEKIARDRALNDDELRAVWMAADDIGGQIGAVYKMLILSGLRLNEVAQATRSEIVGLRWTIPASRMKGKNSKARPHLVPLTDQMVKILDGLPEFTGPYLFSTTSGRRPISMSGKVKAQLDAKLTIAPWWNHDLRRTCRSNLAKLKIAEEVSEAILAHVQPGVRGIYNVHTYETEKLEALEAWGARVAEIVGAPPEPTGAISLADRRKAKRHAAR